MGITQSHFELTDEQIGLLNQYISERNECYAREGERMSGGVRVVFEWSQFGRLVIAYYDNSVDGFEIEGI